MQILRMSRRHLILPLFIASLITCPTLAAAQETSPTPQASSTPPSSQPAFFENQYDGKWHFNITPFLWAPTINGAFHFTNIPSLPPAVIAGGTSQIKSVDLNVGPNKYLAKLNGAAMLSAEIRKGNAAILTNIVWVNLSSTINSVANITGPGGRLSLPITADSGSRVTGTIWELALSPTLLHDRRTSLGAVLGFRYDLLTVSANWDLSGPTGTFARSGSVSEFTNAIAPIIGVTGKLGLSDHFYIPFYGDYGATGGLETFQYIGGLAYAYHSGAYIFVWRLLQYDATQSGSLIQLVRMGGPTLAWTFSL